MEKKVMKKRSMIFVVMATALCANMLFAANLVNNGDFESPVVVGSNNGGPITNWFIPGAGAGLTTAVTPAPMSGQSAWFNNPAIYLYQTFEGVKLLPNRVYIMTLDAKGSAALTINAKILYCSGSGTNSRQIAGLNSADVTNIDVVNGTWLAGWVGVRFDAPMNPADNDASIYHKLEFTTPATITGSTTDDIGITIGGCSGAQVLVDNVSVEVVPEPATIGLLAILGLAFLRRK
jgi:hypothetical protein